MCEIHLYAILFRKLCAQGTHSKDQTEAFQRGGVQAMRQAVQIGSDLTGSIPKFMQPLTGLQGGVCDRLSGSFQIYCQYSEPLIEIIVEFPCKAATLLFLQIDQPATQLQSFLLSLLACRDLGACDDRTSLR